MFGPREVGLGAQPARHPHSCSFPPPASCTDPKSSALRGRPRGGRPPPACGPCELRSKLSLLMGCPGLSVSPHTAGQGPPPTDTQSPRPPRAGGVGRAPKARAGPQVAGGGRAGLASGPAGCPEDAQVGGCSGWGGVGVAEPWFPSQGSKQVGLVANYTGSQQAPDEASWAGPGQ